MLRRLLIPAFTLPLLLTACPGQPTPQPGACVPALSAASVTAGHSLGLGTLTAQAGTPAVNWSAARVPGQLLVLQPGGTLSTQALGVLSALPTNAVLPGLTLVHTPDGETDQALAARLTAAGLRVQPNFIYRALATPNDPAFPGNAGLNVQGLNVSQTYLSRIHAPEAWSYLQGCGKTPVAAKTAVLDTAVDTSHPDLSGRVLAQVSFLASTTFRTTLHGTGTSSVIGAATDNGVGMAGVTWSGPLIPVEVLDATGGTTSDIVKGLNYAVQQGAKVINLSLGGPEDPANPGDAALDAALKAASNSAVLVAAAGNTATDGVYYPADNVSVIAVGAVGASDGALACYSARPNATLPRALDIVAPGGAGYGACPGATPNQDMVVLAPGGGYIMEAGTSFSAPLVSGVAALMRAANPALSAAETKTRLLGSVNTASGLPLLDANAAVRAALR